MTRLLKNPIVICSALIVVFVAPVLVVTLVPGFQPPDLMARRLAADLDAIPDQLVAPQLQQIGKLDQAGTRVLVQALSSERAIVNESAGSALHAQLDQWMRMPASESGQRVAKLAEQLAAHVDYWGESSRSVAADLATRILQWPTGPRGAGRSDLIADCERILQSARDADPLPPVVVTSYNSSSESTLSALRAAIAGDDSRGASELPMSDAAGGDLSIEELQVPSSTRPPAGPPVVRSITDGEPGLLPRSSGERPRVMFPHDKPEKEPNRTTPPTAVPRPLTPSDGADPPAHDAAPASATFRDQELQRMSDLELMYLLNGSRPAELSAVQQQLRQRGFNNLQLNLARRLADPDPLVRLQLARSLTELSRSPGYWLFWLSYDPEPMVRQLVVSLMATSQDPRLHRRLREMQSLETDEAVRNQLSKLYDKQRRR